MGKLRWYWLAGLTVVLLLTAGIVVYLAQPSQPQGFPTSVKNTVSFPLYYPTELPSGYRIDQKSLASQTSSSMVTLLVRSSSQTITVTEQVKPAQHSDIIATEFQKNLSNMATASTPYGDATVGIFSGRLAASLMTSKTWVLVSAPQTVATKDITTLLTHLTLDQ